MAPQLKTYSRKNSTTSKSIDVVNALFAKNLYERNISKRKASKKNALTLKKLPEPDCNHDILDDSEVLLVRKNDTFDEVLKSDNYKPIILNSMHIKDSSSSDASANQLPKIYVQSIVHTPIIKTQISADEESTSKDSFKKGIERTLDKSVNESLEIDNGSRNGSTIHTLNLTRDNLFCSEGKSVMMPNRNLFNSSTTLMCSTPFVPLSRKALIHESQLSPISKGINYTDISLLEDSLEQIKDWSHTPPFPTRKKNKSKVLGKIEKCNNRNLNVCKNARTAVNSGRYNSYINNSLSSVFNLNKRELVVRLIKLPDSCVNNILKSTSLIIQGEDYQEFVSKCEMQLSKDLPRQHLSVSLDDFENFTKSVDVSMVFADVDEVKSVVVSEIFTEPDDVDCDILTNSRRHSLGKGTDFNPPKRKYTTSQNKNEQNADTSRKNYVTCRIRKKTKHLTEDSCNENNSYSKKTSCGAGSTILRSGRVLKRWELQPINISKAIQKVPKNEISSEICRILNHRDINTSKLIVDNTRVSRSKSCSLFEYDDTSNNTTRSPHIKKLNEPAKNSRIMRSRSRTVDTRVTSNESSSHNKSNQDIVGSVTNMVLRSRSRTLDTSIASNESMCNNIKNANKMSGNCRVMRGRSHTIDTSTTSNESVTDSKLGSDKCTESNETSRVMRSRSRTIDTPNESTDSKSGRGKATKLTETSSVMRSRSRTIDTPNASTDSKSGSGKATKITETSRVMRSRSLTRDTPNTSTYSIASDTSSAGKYKKTSKISENSRVMQNRSQTIDTSILSDKSVDQSNKDIEDGAYQIFKSSKTSILNNESITKNKKMNLVHANPYIKLINSRDPRLRRKILNYFNENYESSTKSNSNLYNMVDLVDTVDMVDLAVANTSINIPKGMDKTNLGDNEIILHTNTDNRLYLCGLTNTNENAKIDFTNSLTESDIIFDSSKSRNSTIDTDKSVHSYESCSLITNDFMELKTDVIEGPKDKFVTARSKKMPNKDTSEILFCHSELSDHSYSHIGDRVNLNKKISEPYEETNSIINLQSSQYSNCSFSIDDSSHEHENLSFHQVCDSQEISTSPLNVADVSIYTEVREEVIYSSCITQDDSNQAITINTYNSPNASAETDELICFHRKPKDQNVYTNLKKKKSQRHLESFDNRILSDSTISQPLVQPSNTLSSTSTSMIITDIEQKSLCNVQDQDACCIKTEAVNIAETDFCGFSPLACGNKEPIVIEDSFVMPIMPIQKRPFLRPGKMWRRSLSNYKRNSYMPEFPSEAPIQCNKGDSCSCQGCKQLLELSVCRRSIKIVPQTSARQGSAQISFNVLANTSYAPDNIKALDKIFEGLSVNQSDSLLPLQQSEDLFTARDIVLRRCGQTEPVPFPECYPVGLLKNCHKIGEGVYGEVFLFRNKTGGTSVMKIIPIEGVLMVNGERQKKFDEILTEIVIALELSDLRKNKKNFTSGFSEVCNINCVQGKYPDRLLYLWDLYDDDKGSENDRPDIFDSDQLYIILELVNGGKDLESFVFNNALQSFSLFKQAACSLAIAESALQFEHRDLHWGNILISTVDKNANSTYNLNGREIVVPSNGVQLSIIDFTLSRITCDGVYIFNDLGQDPDLFNAEGDYQFEIYRLMQKCNHNEWQHFEPFTNILWLHYTVDKMITAVRYKYPQTKSHHTYIEKLKQIKEQILNYRSVEQFVTQTLLK